MDGIRQALDRSWSLMEEKGLKPIYSSVKGSVLYELPGTHTDIDIRSVFLYPTGEILSINKPPHTVEVMEGTLDYVGWEAERFFHHLLKHNGTMVEMLQVPEKYALFGDQGLALRGIATKFVTKHLQDYYRGYARSQFKRSQQQIRTGKGAIYTYREMYAGIWLMRTGETIFPWPELRERIEGEGLYRSTVVAEMNMDRTKIDEGILDRMRGEFDELNVVLDAAVEASPLPAEYDGYETCNNLLLHWRSAGWR
jgi:predicted nucleotidyltransferase